MTADGVLDNLASAVSSSDDLETLVGSLLEILQTVTDLESTYLTRIDADKGIQTVVYARNCGALSITEGLTVPLDDNLCKRVLDQGTKYSADVARHWKESQVARDLGLTTNISEPVCIGTDELYGTLCGASRSRVHITSEARRLLSMFAKLIARQLEREQLLKALRQEHKTFSEHALTDLLTGIPNRRALETKLSQALANTPPIHLAFIDLDDFWQINDQYGHDVGDRLLIEIAHALKAGRQEGEFVARFGGDEFVVFGPCEFPDTRTCCHSLEQRLKALTQRSFDLGDVKLSYSGPSIGIVTSSPGDRDCRAFLAKADAAMSAVKKKRKG